MDIKERSIWVNLLLAIAGIPIVSLIGFLIIALIEALGFAITKIQLAGYWWVILIAVYILSLIYFLSELKIRKNIERGKVVNGLILYWKEQLEKQGKPQPSDSEVEVVSEMLLERVKIWAWFQPKLWAESFPDEKYSKYLFGLVGNFIKYYDKQKSKIR